MSRARSSNSIACPDPKYNSPKRTEKSNPPVTGSGANPAAASDFVLLSYLGDGLSTTAIRKRIMHYRDAAGVMLSAHRLRHTFADDLLSVDTPVTSIQQLLGHAWLETTQIYVKANDRRTADDYYTATDKIEGWQ